MTTRTHIIESGYVGRDGQPRVFVKGHNKPLLCDEPLPEGTAVIIIGDKAVKAS